MINIKKTVGIGVQSKKLLNLFLCQLKFSFYIFFINKLINLLYITNVSMLLFSFLLVLSKFLQIVNLNFIIINSVIFEFWHFYKELNEIKMENIIIKDKLQESLDQIELLKTINNETELKNDLLNLKLNELIYENRELTKVLKAGGTISSFSKSLLLIVNILAQILIVFSFFCENYSYLLKVEEINKSIINDLTEICRVLIRIRSAMINYSANLWWAQQEIPERRASQISSNDDIENG